MNAATEKLWAEKASTEEELMNISNSYINMTEQLGAERDSAEEADERVRQSQLRPPQMGNTLFCTVNARRSLLGP